MPLQSEMEEFCENKQNKYNFDWNELFSDVIEQR